MSAPAGNGPRTHELVGEVRDLERRFTERGSEIQGRLTELETRVAVFEKVLAASGLDLEALKLRDMESKTQQRLTFAVGGLMGSLLLMLLAFIATRGG